MSETQNNSGRYLKKTKLGKYVLLNSEKLRRVLDLWEGITQPTNSEEGRILKEAQAIEGKHMGILALYDRLGGGIRDGERKLKTGTFFDFKARKPRTKPEVDENDYEDEYVLTRKKERRAGGGESEADRLKRVEEGMKTESDVVEDEAGEGSLEEDGTPVDAEGNEPEEVQETKASDAAIKKAEELGVDINDVTGTGAGGNIKVSDVEEAAKEA